MAITFLSVLHVVFIILLIVLVLLQDSKGGAMGIFGGGGSNSVFGGGGGGNFLVTATKWVSIFFACSCLALVWITNKKADSVMDSYIPTAAESIQAPTDAVAPSGEEKPAEK